MNFIKKVAVSVLFLSMFSVYLNALSKPANEVAKQPEVSFDIRGDSELCETEYDKCAANCEIKSKTEKAFDACMESCELKYDDCYAKEAQKTKK